MTNPNHTDTSRSGNLVARLREVVANVEAAKRHVYGLPVAAIRSDTHGNKMALWCDNGMDGVGQVCVAVNVGEFPDDQLAAIAGLANSALSAAKCAEQSLDRIEALEASVTGLTHQRDFLRESLDLSDQRIEALEAENERLRYHLEGTLETLLDAEVCSTDCVHCNEARAVLGEKQ